MAKIFIRLPITACVAGPNFRPGTWDRDMMQYVGGCYDQIYLEPNTPFKIEEAEGLRLVERHGGEIIKPGEPEPAEPSEQEMRDSIPAGVIVDNRPSVPLRKAKP